MIYICVLHFVEAIVTALNDSHYDQLDDGNSCYLCADIIVSLCVLPGTFV